MLDETQLKSMNLSERSSLATIAGEVEELVHFEMRRESFELLRNLEAALQEVDRTELGPLVFDYDRLLTKLRFVAFADLTEEEAVALIATHVADIFSTTLDLEDRLQQRLVEMVLLDDRDSFKKRVRDAMIRNTQPLTRATLLLGDDRRQVSPTVGNWIRVYTYAVGSGLIDPLQLSQYYSREENIIKLSPEERKRVRTLLGIYERFKYPSDVVEGFDEPVTVVADGKTYLAYRGEITMLKSSPIPGSRIVSRNPSTRPTKAAPNVTAAVTLQQRVHDLNAVHALDDKKRYDTEEKLVELVGSNTDRLIDVLKTALVSKDHDTTKACVFVFARLGLIEIPLTSKGIRDLFSEEFIRSLADHAGVTYDTAHAKLDANVASHASIAGFLQWVLHRASQNDEAESARLGNAVENTLVSLGSTAFTGMTYFDTTLNCFRWTPLSLATDGSLVERS